MVHICLTFDNICQCVFQATVPFDFRTSSVWEDSSSISRPILCTIFICFLLFCYISRCVVMYDFGLNSHLLYHIFFLHLFSWLFVVYTSWWSASSNNFPFVIKFCSYWVWRVLYTFKLQNPSQIHDLQLVIFRLLIVLYFS